MPFLELVGSPDLADNPRQLGPETVIGSGPQATWRLQRMDLAARHFAIKMNGTGAAKIIPASAQNVVIVNGRQVPTEGATLSGGDVIGAGGAQFLYLMDKDVKRPTLSAPPQAYLINTTERKGYALRKKVVQIGREIGCSIVLKDPTVSRFHADIRQEGGEHVLYSMGSGGTKVNGEPISLPRVLQDGDKIQVGGTAFAFTRGKLPSEVRAADFEDHTDDSFSRRATQVYTSAITGDGPTVRRKVAIRNMDPLLLGVVGSATLVVGLFLYLLLR